MLRLKHLLHPLRTVRIATNRLRAHINMRRFASDSARRFEDDPRYDLQNVTDGFVSRFDKTDDDIGILIRICVAYGKALADQQLASASFNATEWWEQVRQSCLRSVIRALQERDVAALGLIY
jgi:hypothetical protein